MINTISGKTQWNCLFILPLALLMLLSSCEEKTNTPVIVDYSVKETRDQFELLKLDSVYTNLLGTEKDEAEADSLYRSWLNFNRELAKMVRGKQFDWETADSTVILWNRVYCQPGGAIDYYFYYITDSVINQQVGKEYGEFIGKHISGLKYPVVRNFKYSQCGSYRHKNYD